MPRKRFTNEQIACALRQAENGATVDEVCRKAAGVWAALHRAMLEQLQDADALNWSRGPR